MTEPEVLEEVAGAILDGVPVDWAAVETSAAAVDGSVLPELRVLATVKSIACAATPTGPTPHEWGHLRVLERVGRGAFGEVYRAWDTRLDREVALKLLPASCSVGDQPASSIIEEGRLLARVRHPNVVTIYGAERLGDRVGLWMEFVLGRTFEQLLHDGEVFTPDRVSELGIQLCGAVCAVHAARLLHRDIKAQNVMLEENGRLVLMDFGAGRDLAEGSELAAAGTPLYLAPEVLSGDPATESSDVYSVGVLLYHLLTRSYPVKARDLAGLREAHGRRRAADLPTAHIPPPLAQIIRRAIEPDPAARYHSAELLRKELARLRDGQKPGAFPDAPTRPHRHWPWGGGATLVVIGLGVLWGFGGAARSGDSRKASPDKPLLTSIADSSQRPTSSMPVPLTSYVGREDAPAWSPDGREVAFEWDGEQEDNRDIYIVEPGSSQARRLTTAAGADLAPAWSPDGSWIAYVHVDPEERSHTLTLVPPRGGRPHALLTSTKPLGRPSWFPDSGALATAIVPPGEVPAGIWVIDVASGDRRKLTSPPPGTVGEGDVEPAVSPDGRSLAFSRKTAWKTAELFLVDLLPDRSVDGEPRRLTTLGYVQGPSWTPDGTRILFGAAGEGAGVWQVDRIGSAPRPVFGVPETASQVTLARRPEGHVSLVFRNSTIEHSIWRFSTAHRSVQPTELVPSSRNQSYPRYSNHGTRLAFSSTRSGHQEIWVANADGSNPVQLTTLRHQLTEVGHWSPADDAIGFVTQGRGSRQLYVVRASGGEPILLTRQSGVDTPSGWSADGTAYYYTASQNGVRDVWRVNRNTLLCERMTWGGGEHGFETGDGTFYYLRRGEGDVATLMHRTPAGDREVLLRPAATISAQAVPAPDGFYYHAAATNAVYRYQERSRRSHLVLTLPKTFSRLTFTISPDGRWVAGNLLRKWASDLMIMEQFAQ